MLFYEGGGLMQDHIYFVKILIFNYVSIITSTLNQQNTNIICFLFIRRFYKIYKDPIAPVNKPTTCSLDDKPEEYAIGDEGLRHIGYRSAGTLRRRKPSILLQHCSVVANTTDRSWTWLGKALWGSTCVTSTLKLWMKIRGMSPGESLRHNDKRYMKYTTVINEISYPLLEPAYDDIVFAFTALWRV